jgi:phospholipid/cholesterol/gamma-HCH transport system permease protein
MANVRGRGAEMTELAASEVHLSPRQRHSLAALGTETLTLWTELRAVGRLLGECCRAMPRLERSETVRQLYFLGNRSLPFVAVVLGFTGAILVTQASLQAQRVIGDLSLIGPVFLQLLVREFGPTLVGMMIAARYGAGVAAEIGVMVVTEQVDALRMAGTEPAAYLVAPRVVAGVAGAFALAVLGSLVAFAAGGLAAAKGFGVSRQAYLRLDLVGSADVIIGLVKSIAFGMAVPLVASSCGLRARGGAVGVGLATSRAVIGGSVLVLVLDILIGAAGHWLGG